MGKMISKLSTYPCEYWKHMYRERKRRESQIHEHGNQISARGKRSIQDFIRRSAEVYRILPMLQDKETVLRDSRHRRGSSLSGRQLVVHLVLDIEERRLPEDRAPIRVVSADRLVRRQPLQPAVLALRLDGWQPLQARYTAIIAAAVAAGPRRRWRQRAHLLFVGVISVGSRCRRGNYCTLASWRWR